MEAHDVATLIISIVNLVAIIIVPILAVVIGQYLQTKAKKREDKLQIFKLLMTTRIYGWTIESVQALNVIDIVFADDEKVRAAWKTLHECYCVKDPSPVQLSKIDTAKLKLLETMAISLGYKEQVTWDTIQNPYLPDGMVLQHQAQAQYQSNLTQLVEMILKNAPQTNNSTNNDTANTPKGDQND